MSHTNIWPLVECLWEQAISLPSSTLTPFTSDSFQIRNFFEVSGLSSIVYFSKHHKASGIHVFLCWGPPCNPAWIWITLSSLHPPSFPLSVKQSCFSLSHWESSEFLGGVEILISLPYCHAAFILEAPSTPFLNRAQHGCHAGGPLVWRERGCLSL